MKRKAILFSVVLLAVLGVGLLTSVKPVAAGVCEDYLSFCNGWCDENNKQLGPNTQCKSACVNNYMDCEAAWQQQD